MPLTDPSYWISGLCEIDLPGGAIRLCDGGFVNWPSVGLFTSEDSTFGTIESVDALTENIGDEAPAGKLTLLPPSISASADLYRSDAQNSPMTFWLAEINPATGAITGTPELQFTGFLDTLDLKVSAQSRKVEIGFVAAAERLFLIREGNVLSPRFHATVWAGELGLDFATGIQLAVPWGVAGPGRGTISLGGGGFGGRGGVRGGVSV